MISEQEAREIAHAFYMATNPERSRPPSLMLIMGVSLNELTKTQDYIPGMMYAVTADRVEPFNGDIESYANGQGS